MQFFNRTLSTISVSKQNWNPHVSRSEFRYPIHYILYFVHSFHDLIYVSIVSFYFNSIFFLVTITHHWTVDSTLSLILVTVDPPHHKSWSFNSVFLLITKHNHLVVGSSLSSILITQQSAPLYHLSVYLVPLYPFISLMEGLLRW